MGFGFGKSDKNRPSSFAKKKNIYPQTGRHTNTSTHSHTQTDTPRYSGHKRLKHMYLINKNAKALKYIQSFYLAFCDFASFVQPFNLQQLYFNGRFRSNALNIHIFMLSGSKSVGIRISFSDSRHFRY